MIHFWPSHDDRTIHMGLPQGCNLIFHSVRPGGGMERYVLDLIGALSKLGTAVRVIAQRVEWAAAPSSVEFVVLPPRTGLARLDTLLFERTALRYARSGWPTLAISRVAGAEIAIAGGTHLGHLHERKKRPGWFDRRTVAHEHALYAQARAIVAHSGKVANEIATLYDVPPTRIHTLRPPVDTAAFSLAARKNRAATRVALSVADDEFLLLFPSNNHALKGADLILAALADFPSGIRLAVAGKAPLNAPGVLNLGFRQDMPALYAAADAVILASRYEAFGMVGPEAVLCGTPVLFADTVGAVEVLSDTACLRFARTVEGLRRALDAALQRRAAGTLSLPDPAVHIHYPYSVDQHASSVLALLDA